MENTGSTLQAYPTLSSDTNPTPPRHPNTTRHHQTPPDSPTARQLRQQNVCEDVYALARSTRQTRHTPTAPTARQTRQARQHPTGPDSTRQPCRQHPTAPDSTHPQLTPEENREHTREAQRPMPEDADQDILERLVCLWPTTRSNRAKLTC